MCSILFKTILNHTLNKINAEVKITFIIKSYFEYYYSSDFHDVYIIINKKMTRIILSSRYR